MFVTFISNETIFSPFSENSSPTELLHLCGKDGHVTVHSAVMSSELMGTAPTDLPYILRVESRQRCWPVQNLYLLAPSFPVKQKWVTSLEFVLDEIKKRNNNGDDQVCTWWCSFFFSKRWGEAWSERVLDEKIWISGNGPRHIQTLHFYPPIRGCLS